MNRDLAAIKWIDAAGKPIACIEKLKMLTESLAEFQQLAADTLADAVLVGCRENDVRAVLDEIVDKLESPFKPKG